jgi:uncharacterized membrane protein
MKRRTFISTVLCLAVVVAFSTMAFAADVSTFRFTNCSPS